MRFSLSKQEILFFFLLLRTVSKLGWRDVVLSDEYVEERCVIFISDIVGDLLERRVLVKNTVVRSLHSQMVDVAFEGHARGFFYHLADIVGRIAVLLRDRRERNGRGIILSDIKNDLVDQAVGVVKVEILSL